MKTSKRKVVIRVFPAGDACFWMFVLVCAILFAGKPDLMDAIIHNLMEPDVTKQVDESKGP